MFCEIDIIMSNILIFTSNMKILCRILSIPRNNVMNLNNVCCKTYNILEKQKLSFTYNWEQYAKSHETSFVNWIPRHLVMIKRSWA